MMWLFLALLLFGGCIGGEEDKPTTNKVSVIEDQEGTIEIIAENNSTSSTNLEGGSAETDTNVTINWTVPGESLEDVSNYSFKEKDPVYVRFFDVGLPNSDKQGRLIQIRRGDLDIFIWSVPKEMFPKAYGYVKSYSDDIEYLIVPSPRSVNTESLELLLNKTKVGTIIAPATMNLSYENVSYWDTGHKWNIAGFSLKALKAGEKGYENPGDKGFILLLNTSSGCFIFFLDSDGLFKLFTREYASQIQCDYFSWNSYGGIIDPNSYQLFFALSKPRFMVSDGAEHPIYDAEGASRDGIYNRAQIHNVNYTKVWEHNMVYIAFDKNSSRMGWN